MRLLLKNCKLVEGIRNILIEDEKIASIQEADSHHKEGQFEPGYDKIIDIRGNTVIPGMIDPHVHMRDLKQAYKEDWTSGSEAALAGGITTVFDMPNTKPDTMNLENLNLKRQAAKSSKVKYKFHIGATCNNLEQIKIILKNNPDDIAGIKIFLAASSSNEVVTDRQILKQIFKIAKQYDKVVVVHTELQECLDKWLHTNVKRSVINHNIFRHRICAIEGTKLVLEIADEVKNSIYIAHVSTSEEINLIKRFKEKNNVYCEITPHHLLLNEKILGKVGNWGKVNPPLRTDMDNVALWNAVHNGTVDTIGTDHAPHSIEEKQQEYSKAPSGFPGLETCLPLLLTEISPGFDINKIIELTSRNTAKIFGLEKNGKIKKGNYADLAVIDLNKKWAIDASKFKTKAKYSPFDEVNVKGKIVMTFVNGRCYKFEE